MDEIKIRELVGANMDIDLVSDNVDWDQSVCPWNKVENTKEHNSLFTFVLLMIDNSNRSLLGMQK